MSWPKRVLQTKKKPQQQNLYVGQDEICIQPNHRSPLRSQNSNMEIRMGIATQKLGDNYFYVLTVAPYLLSVTSQRPLALVANSKLKCEAHEIRFERLGKWCGDRNTRPDMRPASTADRERFGIYWQIAGYNIISLCRPQQSRSFVCVLCADCVCVAYHQPHGAAHAKRIYWSQKTNILIFNFRSGVLFPNDWKPLSTMATAAVSVNCEHSQHRSVQKLTAN